MNPQPNSKILGAFVIGFALVAFAYVSTNFAEPTGQSASTNTAVEATPAPLRVAIDVTDNDNNGIEDWRDELITSDPVIIRSADADEPYEAPDTLTGQLGINFVQNMVLARTRGSFGRSEEQVIADTVTTLERESSVSMYNTPDIIILNNWDETSIKTYANTVAQAIIDNSNGELENELFILRDIINREDKTRLAELKLLALVFSSTRDALLATPVPSPFAKQHLDLINTLHAVAADIDAMTLAFSDPARALLRLKRYEEDSAGLTLALQNMYLALEPYASLFTVEDPAVLFVVFSPQGRL